MGVQLDDKDDLQLRYKKALREINDLAVYRIISPWLYPYFIYFFTPMHWRERRVVKFLHEFSRRVIEDRKKTFEGSFTSRIEDEAFMSKKRLAMLDLMLSAKEDNGVIDDQGIQEEVDTFIMEVSLLENLEDRISY